MTSAPSFDDIFAVMSAASVGDMAARVAVPESPRLDDTATMFAIALNILLDDLALGVADGQRELAERGRLANRQQILADASREFSAATGDLAHLLDVVACRLGELVGDLCVIRAITEDGEWLESKGAAFHRDPELLAATREVMLSGRQRVGEGVSGRVAASGQALLTPRISTSDFVASSEPRFRPFLERLGVASSMTLPLLCRGKVVGIANLMRSSPDRPYDEDDLRLVQSVADHAALAMGNARSYAAERAARDAAEKATSALREAQARFSRLSESGIIGINIADINGNILEANDTYMKMVGYSREELLQGSIRWADLTPAEFRDDADHAVAQLRATGVAGPWETETFRKDGSRVSMIVGVAMLEYPRCIAFTADITERKQAEAGRIRAEEALRQSEEQLRQAQKMEAVGRLAGGVAHDFNNVLSVILSYGEVILGDLKPTDPLRADMEEIRKAALRAAGLTRQLLLFSRQQVVEAKVIDLHEVLTSMDRMLQRILGEDVELVSVATKSVGRVKVDPSHIEQVILNLVVNARDAMPTGGKLTIETADVVLDESYAMSHLSAKVGPHVMMSVSDTGIGMDRETQTRIFEPFFTTKELGKGTGLGLSTVFGIVQQSGGSIRVDSEPGKGTTFWVYLPRVDAEVDLVRPQVAPATLRGTETILLVEDEEQVRTVVVSILRRQGYRVLPAQHGGEALLLCERHPETIDLLLTDVVMPQMSGPELARRLAATRPKMKILCMSGYTDDSIARHGALESDMAYLQKPVTPQTLTAKVREVLDSSRR
jgi:two-component system cell cycle sensor histidine kinase/response regulator CckA